MTRTVTLIACAVALVAPAAASAHLVAKPHNHSLYAQAVSQQLNLDHARYVCRHGGHAHKRWACKAVVWLGRELGQTKAAITAAEYRRTLATARGRAIAAAEEIRARGGNPWPNCPDPNDGASWDDTKNCESPGYGWHEDPPGYFCGPLQFDPAYWGDLIRRYGIPC